MSVVIQRIEAQEDGKCLALVRHEENEFLSHVCGNAESLSTQLGRECIVEIGYTRVVAWKELPGFVDDQSFIRPSRAYPGAISVKGRVHGVIAVGDGEEIIDLYVQNGPEFLSIAKSELGAAAPTIGNGMEVTLEGLCFYPTNT